MAKIKFDNGVTVNFDGNPTPADVEEVAKKIGISKSQKAPVMGDSAIGRFSTGIAKGAVQTIKNMSSIGEKILQAPYKLFGVKFDDKTGAEQGQQMLEQKAGIAPGQLLEPQNTTEDIGKKFEQVAELFIPVLKGSKTIKGATKAKTAINIAKNAATEAADMAIKTGIQTQNAKDTGIAAAWGAGGSLVGSLASVGLPQVSKWLEKSTLKLSPTQKINMAKQIDGATKYLNENKIVGTPGMRYEKIITKYDEAEDVLQEFLTKGEGAGTTVSREALKQQIGLIPQKYVETGKVRDLIAMRKQLKEAQKSLDVLPEQIPTWMANNFKRDVYGSAYNTAGNKVLDPVEHDIGDITRLAIENATSGKTINGKSIEAFNETYGQIINAKKLLKAASTKSQIGILGKILGYTIGGAITKSVGGGNVATALGSAGGALVAESALGTLPRTLLAAGIDKMNPVAAEEAIRKILQPYILPKQ